MDPINTTETQTPAAPETDRVAQGKPYVSSYAVDAARLRAGLTCGKCDDYHAPWRCPACD